MDYVIFSLEIMSSISSFNGGWKEKVFSLLHFFYKLEKKNCQHADEEIYL